MTGNEWKGDAYSYSLERPLPAPTLAPPIRLKVEKECGRWTHPMPELQVGPELSSGSVRWSCCSASTCLDSRIARATRKSPRPASLTELAVRLASMHEHVMAVIDGALHHTSPLKPVTDLQTCRLERYAPAKLESLLGIIDEVASRTSVLSTHEGSSCPCLSLSRSPPPPPPSPSLPSPLR